MPAAVMAIMDQLPIGTIIAVAFLAISIVFVATTTDTMSYTVAVTLTGNDHPARWLRVFWALIFGGTTMVILTIGEGSITAIQTRLLSPLCLCRFYYCRHCGTHRKSPKDGARTRPHVGKTKKRKAN